MAALMVSELKHSRRGNWGTAVAAAHKNPAQQADWGAAAKSNLFDK